MRTMLFVLTMAACFVLTSPASATPYCDGYVAGYNKGCVAAAPLRCRNTGPRSCPRPRDTQSTYDEGFTRGHKDGENAARSQKPCDRDPAPSWCSAPPTSDTSAQEGWQRCKEVCTYVIENGREGQSCRVVCD